MWPWSGRWELSTEVPWGWMPKRGTSRTFGCKHREIAAAASCARVRAGQMWVLETVLETCCSNVDFPGRM